MKKVILKYEVINGTMLEIPRGKCIHVEYQGKDLQSWWEVDPDGRPRMIKFHVYGTGEIYEHRTYKYYIGTVQQGPFVWHVFYELVT